MLPWHNVMRQKVPNVLLSWFSAGHIPPAGRRAYLKSSLFLHLESLIENFFFFFFFICKLLSIGKSFGVRVGCYVHSPFSPTIPSDAGPCRLYECGHRLCEFIGASAVDLDGLVSLMSSIPSGSCNSLSLLFYRVPWALRVGIWWR